MAWRVVSPNAGLVTNREVLQLLRQRGLRTAAEAAEDEERAAHALETATAALSVREDEEGADEGVGEAAGGEPLRAAAAAAAAEASRAASLPVPLYPRRNPPFRIEREVFDYLMQTPAAAQDEEKLERVVDYITTSLELTKSELLQLLNTKPTTTVELHCIVESAATRMSDAEQADLLELISSAC